MTLALLVSPAGELVVSGQSKETGDQQDSSISRQVANDLKAFYADSKTKPPYQKALEQLGNADETARNEAGRYLAELLSQSYADQISMRAPSRSLPFWGGGVDNDAENLRKDIAQKLAATEGNAAGLDGAQWLIEKDPSIENQISGFTFVRKTKTLRSDEVIISALATPHHNTAVVLAAIEEAMARNLPVQAQIIRLCGWYRTAVREASRNAAIKLKTDSVPPFKPAEAFSPWLDEQMKNFASMAYPEIPKDAKWMRFSYVKKDEFRENGSFSGWLMGSRDGKLHILDYFGEDLEIKNEDLSQKPRTFEEDALMFAEARKTGNKVEDHDKMWQVLSSWGGLTGQFEPAFISAPEALVAAWSYRSGNKELAASILFPRINGCPDDLQFVSAVRDLLGKACHQEMLEAFCEQRDYEKALLIAKHLSQPAFDGYFYQPRAKELATQIEKRRDDFKTFTLPTPDGWKKQKESMPRPAQIEFLASHLRLLNCVQMGQPGGVDYDDPQITVDPSAKEPKPVDVINPYSELKQMKLSAADLVSLVPFLADADFMLTYSYWRDFHPGRSLHRVNWAVAHLVNDAAGRNLVDMEHFDSLTPGEKQRVAEKAVAWCRENSGKSIEDRFLETLSTTRDRDEFERIASKVVSQKIKSAAVVMTKRMDDFDWNFRGRILQFCYMLDTSDVLPFAQEWFARYPDKHVQNRMAEDDSRFWAAMLILRYSKEISPEALKELKVLLHKKAGDENWHVYSIDLLLSLKNEEAALLACEILQNIKINRANFEAPEILKRLFLAGRQEALDFLSVKLDSTVPTGRGSNGKNQQFQIVEGDNAAEIISRWHNEKQNYDPSWPEEQRKKKRQYLKKWLAEQFALIKEGKQSAIAKPEPLHGSHFVLDAP